MQALRISATLGAAALALAGCGTLAMQPVASPATLAGEWQRDAAASDDFDRKLTALLDTLRHRTAPHHGAAGAAGATGAAGGRRGGGPSGGGEDSDANTVADGEGDALGIPQEEPDKARNRLAEDLRPPASIRIAVDGAAVEITRDSEPMRQFLPGQSVSRIDASGAASLTSGWNKNAFVISARYTDRATRTWRYELEPASGMLRVSFDANDPEFGRLLLLTRYRRAKLER